MTPEQTWLASLPDDRREALTALIDRIRQEIPAGYEEAFSNGFFVWQVPLAVYPDTYNRKPLMYVALANQGGHVGIYLCGVYGLEEVRSAFCAKWTGEGKRLDMGKACVRVKRLSDISLPAVGEAVAAVPMEAYVRFARATQAATKTGQRKASREG